MRSQQEMLQLIVDTAQADERIRAVIMNGSRANPNATRDIFQDFDIVYVVSEVDSFKYDYAWLERFGERMIMQMPEDMQDPPPSNDGGFAYLMQFADGNRIDLGLYPIDRLAELGRDSQSILLLDKDGLVEPFPPPSDSDYLPKPPTAKAFADCCNEFWWVSPYVAKGLWRDEIVYAKTLFEGPVRDELTHMLVWYIGMQTDFSKNPGKFGKYYKKYLPAALWEQLLKTYADASPENAWEALFTMCDLFRTLAVQIAGRFNFDYPHGDDGRVSAHLKHVRDLPRTAKQMY